MVGLTTEGGESGEEDVGRHSQRPEGQRWALETGLVLYVAIYVNISSRLVGALFNVTT